MCSTGIYVSLKRREGMEKSWLRIKLRPHKGDPCWLQEGPIANCRRWGCSAYRGPYRSSAPPNSSLALEAGKKHTVSVCDIIPDFFSVISNNTLLSFPLLGP